MNNKTYKFLITPNYAAPYDQRMVQGLADGLKGIGHEALALSAPISSTELLNQCKKYSIDVVMQVNRTRTPDVDLPARVRYISWYQDVFPETLNNFSERFRDSDILYSLGDPEVLGLRMSMPCYVGSLLSGVDQKILSPKQMNGGEKTDFSLCGFIPAPPRTRGVFKAMRATVENHYRPLSGALDIHALEGEIRKAMAQAQYANMYALIEQQLLNLLYRLRYAFRHNDFNNSGRLSPMERSINYYTREYPRLLDRVVLVDKVLGISQSLKLYGPGWDRHAKYKKYFNGIIASLDGLLNVYRNSRINLANNTHGLGLHSRTLECMAVGGFIFTHESPNDNRAGGILTSFEPGVHFGAFNADNLQEQAMRWLADDNKRLHAGMQASKIVSQQHCWHHRAMQIADDLMK